MPTLHKSALVPYSAEATFAVVNDVNAYPRFLAGCQAARVIQESETEMLAELRLGLGAIAATFTTRNTLARPHKISLLLENGPFRDFTGSWEFVRLAEDATRVTFDIEFSMKNKLTAGAVELMLTKVSNDMVSAIVTELDRRSR